MKRFSARMLVLLLLFVSTAGAHAHYCFDGQEPLVSMHLDNLQGHEMHAGVEGHDDHGWHEGHDAHQGHEAHDANDESQVHVDADKDLMPQHLLSKKADTDPALPLLAILLVFLAVPAQNRFPKPAAAPAAWQTPLTLRPPLRAPPHISC